jgi:hypothetical protein
MTSQENMDEEERMELALNSDFDSALLACWEKSPRHNGGDNIDDEGDDHFNGRRIDHSERSAPSGGHRDAGNWEAPAASDRFFRLPSFTMEDEAFYQRSTAPAMPQAQQQQHQSNLHGEASSDSGSSNAVNNISASETGSVSTNRDQQTMPTFEISHSKDSSNVGSTSSIGQASSLQSMEPKQLRKECPNSPVQLHPLAFQASANCPPHVPNAAPAPLNYPTQPELMPLAYNAMAAGMSFANPMLFQPRMQPQMQAPSIRLPEMHAAPPLPPPPPVKKSRRKGKGKVTTAKAAAANAPPPFLLFDAPVELRANFMNAQRSHGLPTMQDNNAYHYGMAVNGFHPQDHLNPNPSTRAVSEGGSSTSNNTVRLIDGRHGNQGMKRLKNVKEQKRAQRITDLIEQLREKMEQDGWNVGMKSKFHTLSS